MEGPGRELRVGIAGLGMAGGGIVRGLASLPGVTLAAACDPREHAVRMFEDLYGGIGYERFEELCADPNLDAVWVATPSHLHREHVVMLAEAGKHIVVEKPMAIHLDDCLEMIAAAEDAGVTLIAGGARSFDPAFQAMRQVIMSGRLGRLGGLATWAFTGWMTRAREPHELDPARDGGCIFNQGPHSVDVLRLLGGGLVRSVRGSAIDLHLPGRPGPGYFSAFLEFEDGTPAILLYNGYGYIEGWEMVPWGETDSRLAWAANTAAYRRSLRDGSADEVASRERLRFGGTPKGAPFPNMDEWTPIDAGLVVVTCENGEIRQSRKGLYVYDDEGRHDERLPDEANARLNEVNELRMGMAGGTPNHSGRWGMATMEAVEAIAESSKTHKEIVLKHQVPTA